jgi:hypothetical protein
LLATTILGTPVPDDVMAVHYDVILPTGALQLPDDYDPTEADEDLIDRIRSALNAVGNSSPAAWKRFRLLRPLYTDR